MRETREETKEKVRPTRVPVYEANRNKLTVQGLDEANYHYRWVNDTSGRLATFQEAGYEFVDKKGLAPEFSGVDTSDVNGSALSRGMGAGVTAFLMRIPKEIYLADVQKKEKELNAPLEAAMKQKARDSADYGKLTISSEKS